MEYKAKSAIIGRKKDSGQYGAFVALFTDVNEPHKSGKAPDKILDFLGCRNVKIKGFDCKFMIGGADIVINDIERLDIEEKDMRITITGKQKK
jgi:hypothetical protein